MNKRAINGGSGVKTPMVFLTQNVGGTFVGVLKDASGKAVKLARGEKYIFRFAVESGDAFIAIKNDAGEYVEASVSAGDEVSILATAPLRDKLLQCKVGERVEIIYNGKKISPKSGNNYHDFSVSVLEG